MSCYNNNCYLPNPPRAWSRVQNSCSLNTDNNNSGVVQLPYSNKIIPVASLGLELAMLNKGNVLQYKANSSNLTKAQKYSKIVQGQWVNRNTTWATQSTRGYTNPNTTSLKRSGNVVNIAIDPITGAIIGPTAAPPTCPQSVIPINNGIPSNGGGGSDVDDPNIPPPVEPTPGSNTFPDTIPDTPVEPIVIQDGGILICSVQENICTGETKSTLSQQLCNPTSDSDVPGTIQELCWNDGTPTWYPRSRYVMTNSANKWPVNATLVSAILPLPPEPPTNLSYITINASSIKLTWGLSSSCVPINYYIIYQDGTEIGTRPYTYFIVNNLTNCNSYTFSVLAVDAFGNQSTISTINNVIPLWPNPPTNLSGSTTIPNPIINLTWSAPNPNCSEPTSYTLYWSTDNITFFSINNIPYPDTSYDFTSGIINTTYYFYMESVNSLGSSTPSSTIIITPSDILYAITGDTNFTETIIGDTYTLTFNPNTVSDIDGEFNITFYGTINNVIFTLVGGGGGGAGSGYHPNNAYLMCGVGGGGASSMQTSLPIVANSSFDLNVGIGGTGGLGNQSGTSPNFGTSGGTTTVVDSNNTILNCSAPGGNASNTIGYVSGTQGVYYLNGSLPTVAPTCNIPSFVSCTGGASVAGGGVYVDGSIYHSVAGGPSAPGGNGHNATGDTGTLPYGGGGGSSGGVLPYSYTQTMENNTTTYGAVVSSNNIGGLAGTSQVYEYDTKIPGNQTTQGSGIIGTPGPGSGGGGAGLWFTIYGAYTISTGKGGDGGDGLIIITFTYPNP